MKYLVGIPCLYGAGHTKDAIESVVYKDNVDMVLIDNGAEEGVKEVLNYYSERENVLVIHNEQNIYVNPAWNQIINYFLSTDHDYLLIMNSDLILQKDWNKVLDMYFENYPDLIPIPVIEEDLMKYNNGITLTIKHKEVTEGTAGVLIIINRKQAKNIYPIPNYIKIWFGDNWIYEILRTKYKTVIVENLVCYHSGSQNIIRLKEANTIIENDKIDWGIHGHNDIMNRIDG